jgi:molybdate transport repressor ModE-like protein
MIEMKFFRLMEAIAQEGSLSGAAKAIGHSQPSVSQQVQQLERLLNTPVLVRTRGGVTFTEAGKVLLRHGTSILASARLAASEVEAVAGLRAGRVRVASFPSAAATLLPKAFADMRKDHPGVSFTLLEGEPDRALNLLRNGECDIAIVYTYANSNPDGAPHGLDLMPDEVAIPLVEEFVRVAVPVDHPRANDKTVELSDLAGDTWIAGCPDCRGNLLALCDRAGFAPEIGFETDDYVALQGLVEAGLGVALVPDLMLAASHRDFPLTLKALAPRSTRVVSAVVSSALLAVPGIAPTIAALERAAASYDFSGSAAVPA